MATAAPLATLEDLAYCPVCFEFYTNPQSLSCRHVLCENCIQQLVKFDQVECPECRQVSFVMDIKKDFNKQNLVDVFLRQQEADVSNSIISIATTEISEDFCKTCEKPNKIEWSCQECNQTMCAGCYKAHNSFPVTKNHHVTSIEDVAKDITEGIDETIKRLQSLKDTIRERLKDQGNVMQELVVIKTDTIDDINCRRNSLKKKVDDQHDDAINEVEKIIAEELHKSNRVQETIHSYFRETDKRIKILTDLKASDVSNLVDNGRLISNDICLGITKTQKEVEAVSLVLAPEVSLVGPHPWSPDQGTQVLVKAKEEKSVGQDHGDVCQKKEHKSEAEQTEVGDKSKDVSISSETDALANSVPEGSFFASSKSNAANESQSAMKPNPVTSGSPKTSNVPRSVSVKSSVLPASSSPAASSVPRSMSMKSGGSASPRLGGHSVSSDSIAEDRVSVSYSMYSSSDTTSQVDADAFSGRDVEVENGFENYLKLISPGVKYRRKNLIKLTSVPWKVMCYGEYIICVLDEGCYIVYDITGQRVKTVRLQKVRKVRAVVNDGAETIVATKEGLHLLNDQGCYLCCIRDGKFSDVILRGGFLYALEYKKKKVVTFQKQPQQGAASSSTKWVQVKSTPLNLTAGCECDTLCVTHEALIVGSDVNCCVYTYSHKGSQLKKRGVSGVAKPEELYKPRLAGVDQQGGLLVADCYNNQIKVCSPSGRWTVVSTNTVIKPMDVAVSDDGNTLWVATLDKEIVMCTRVG